MKDIGAREIDRRAFRGVAWMGKAALFCLGLLAMLAVLVATTALTPVMLAAAALPAVRQKHGHSPKKVGEPKGERA